MTNESPLILADMKMKAGNEEPPEYDILPNFRIRSVDTHIFDDSKEVIKWSEPCVIKDCGRKKKQKRTLELGVLVGLVSRFINICTFPHHCK